METDITERNEKHVYFHIPFSTIVKVLVVLLILACLKVIGPLLMTLFLAVLLAVSLTPVVDLLVGKRVPRKVAIVFIAMLLITLIVTIGALIVPQLAKEFAMFIENLPRFKAQILDELSDSNPIRPIIKTLLNHQTFTTKNIDITPLFSIGNMALSGLLEIVLIFVFTIYLLADGRGAIAWFSAFFSAPVQAKLVKTASEVSLIIYSYVAGQMITSVCSFIYVWIALSWLQVPSALLLAALAGIFDVLPVLGFFFAVVPAMLFALSVSGSTAMVVLALYIIYHGIENYFIIPAVYGSRLRISGFMVLLSLIAAGLLTGVEGAIAILPVVASYPIIERIWLKKLVGHETVAEHVAVAESTT